MAAPYSVQMDAQAAQSLAEAGAALLLLDVPQGSFMGIDHQVRTYLSTSFQNFCHLRWLWCCNKLCP